MLELKEYEREAYVVEVIRTKCTVGLRLKELREKLKFFVFQGPIAWWALRRSDQLLVSAPDLRRLNIKQGE